MTQNRDQQNVCNAFAGLIDNSAATAAANRLYQEHDEGMRFCCDSGERITPEEARIRDARDAARRGQSYTEPESFSELTSSALEFSRRDSSFDDDFDPSLELDPDENYEIDLDEDLDIIAIDDNEIGVLELLD